MSTIAVLIPYYNQELTIKKVIKDFRKALPQAEIYVYNNNSKDRPEEIGHGIHLRNEQGAPHQPRGLRHHPKTPVDH